MPGDARPHLTRADPRRPRGVVLMLHGGAEDNTEFVDGRSRSWLRSRLMMLQLQRGLRRQGLSVWLLRYRYVGWNARSSEHSPVPDARWALERVRAAHGAVPVVVLGHSMGARSALAVADDRAVVGVVALAPWFPAGEDVGPLAGKVLRAAHGRADDITSFDATAAFVRRATARGIDATLADMGDVGHYMLRSLTHWNRFARDEVLALLG